MCQEPFTQMVHKYQNLVFSICVKMTGDYFAAEDLTQETFLSAYQHKEEFDGKNEKAWLCRIASNKCIDYSRQAARRMVPTEDRSLRKSSGESGRTGRTMHRRGGPGRTAGKMRTVETTL